MDTYEDGVEFIFSKAVFLVRPIVCAWAWFWTYSSRSRFLSCNLPALGRINHHSCFHGCIDFRHQNRQRMPSYRSASFWKQPARINQTPVCLSICIDNNNNKPRHNNGRAAWSMTLWSKLSLAARHENENRQILIFVETKILGSENTKRTREARFSSNDATWQVYRSRFDLWTTKSQISPIPCLKADAVRNQTKWPSKWVWGKTVHEVVGKKKLTITEDSKSARTQSYN